MDYQIEVTGSTTTAALLEQLGANAAEVKAVWFAFPQACFVPAAQFGDELELSAGMLRTYGEGDCMCDALRACVDELRMATECTCTLGHEGGYQISAILTDGCNKKGQPGDIALMRDLAPEMVKHAMCDEGKAIGRAVLQALDLFAGEIEPHFSKRSCPTGGCRAFQTYHILVSKCTGCGECLKACGDDAIMGKPKFVHVINQKLCVQCDKCREACPEDAVVTAGANKPKTPPKPKGFIPQSAMPREMMYFPKGGWVFS